MPSAAAVRVALLLLLSALLLCGLRTAAAQSLAFSLVTATAGWSARDSLGAFEWSGQVWIAGGFTGGQEVWSSGDLGRTWVKSNTSLSTGFTNNCILNQNALVYANAVYLACDQYATQKNSDPALVAAWTALNGVGALVNNHYRESMSVVRMAVPFDGVGTLIAINDYDDELGINYNDVWTLSATGTFAVNNVKDTWTPTGYLAPWPVRFDQMAATDAEGLVLIMAGGYGNTSPLSDVWQLTWSSSTAAPLMYQLTPMAPWAARSSGALYSVHDWLLVCGGQVKVGATDDAWLSADYGTTWVLANAAATGIATGKGRFDFGAAVVSRRLLLLGGLLTATYKDSASVYQAFW